MNDEFETMLMVALDDRAASAPRVAGFTDVRRRVRRRRQRQSALVVLPTLVGASAVASWMRADDASRISGDPSNTAETTTPPPSAETTTSLSTRSSERGFRCSAAGMLAGDAYSWLYFQGCESWGIRNVALRSPTSWNGPSTQEVAFVNASTVDGAATYISDTRFGAGEVLSSPTNSDTSFVMYDDPVDERTATAIAGELGVALKSTVDPSFAPIERQTLSSIVVVIGEDIAIGNPAASAAEDVVPVQPPTGVASRCWAQSEVVGDELGYRFFVVCEATQPESGEGTEAASSTETGTNPLATALGCSAGSAVVRAGENPSMVAAEYDITVAELDAANADTPGYSSWLAGMVLIIPCPAAR